MAQIHVLDTVTIDKIAAGEVVERPASVVKELVENAIDAGARAIAVEAREGGIDFIRVTDDGSGMDSTQVRMAFLRHATSKITTLEDLTRVSTLGFRGEALSSIAAVSKVELITRTKEALVGLRLLLDGGVEQSLEEIGAPAGTTFIMRNLFYHTPVRRKFLKQPVTEGGYIADLMEHLALSRPDISFKFMLGSRLKFHTSGSGDLQEAIYRIFGKEIGTGLIPIKTENAGIKVNGFLGKPELSRSNRNYEIYFINGRFIKNQLMAKAIEEGYKGYLMQHKFPLCFLHINLDGETVDINVHPTKMDVRFSDAPSFCNTLTEAIRDTLSSREMIPEISLSENRLGRSEPVKKASITIHSVPEPFESVRKAQAAAPVKKEQNHINELNPMEHEPEMQDIMQNTLWEGFSVQENATYARETSEFEAVDTEGNYITEEARAHYRILGQVFDTYWLVQIEDKLLMIDQHAAHEKVKYERLIHQFRENEVLSQVLMPPIICSLSGQEETVLKEHLDTFQKLGFEIEHFGGSEYALRGVPLDLYGYGDQEMFLSVLDELCEYPLKNNPGIVEEKIASMSCKAAVKGNHSLSQEEAEELLDELLTLDNPYRCPHGRPVIVAMSKGEIERKFKRIL